MSPNNILKLLQSAHVSDQVTQKLKQKEREYQDEKKRRETAEAALATATRDLATVNGMYATAKEQLAKFEKLANDVFQKK